MTSCHVITYSRDRASHLHKSRPRRTLTDEFTASHVFRVDLSRLGSTMPFTMESSASPARMESRPPSPSRFTGQRIHFIGIGGSGMSGLARMLLDNGAIVSGSEPNY